MKQSQRKLRSLEALYYDNNLIHVLICFEISEFDVLYGSLGYICLKYYYLHWFIFSVTSNPEERGDLIGTRVNTNLYLALAVRVMVMCMFLVLRPNQH
jgi:hypothetical protein